MQYLMIRGYYLKGPTVTDLFVISCHNSNDNEFICINASVVDFSWCSTLINVPLKESVTQLISSGSNTASALSLGFHL